MSPWWALTALTLVAGSLVVLRAVRRVEGETRALDRALSQLDAARADCRRLARDAASTRRRLDRVGDSVARTPHR